MNKFNITFDEMQILHFQKDKASLLENAWITREMVVFTFDNVKFIYIEII